MARRSKASRCRRAARRKRHDPPALRDDRHMCRVVLWEAQGGRCAHCGVPCLLTTAYRLGGKRSLMRELFADRCFTLDHRIPLARGGRTVLGNLAGVCLRCNTAKADLDEASFSALASSPVSVPAATPSSTLQTPPQVASSSLAPPDVPASADLPTSVDVARLHALLLERWGYHGACPPWPAACPPARAKAWHERARLDACKAARAAAQTLHVADAAMSPERRARPNVGSDLAGVGKYQMKRRRRPRGERRPALPSHQEAIA